MEMADTKKCTRENLVNDGIYAKYKNVHDDLDNKILIYKTQIKSYIQSIVDYKSGLVDSINLNDVFERICKCRSEIRAINDMKKDVETTYDELLELEVIKI